MIVGLGEEFDAAGGVELMESVHHFGNVLLELLEGDAGDRVGNAEAAFVHFDGVEESAIGRQIAFMGHFPADFGVFEVVEIVAVGIKDAIAAETEGLMDLEIKTNRWHFSRPFEQTLERVELVWGHCSGLDKTVHGMRQRSARVQISLDCLPDCYVLY